MYVLGQQPVFGAEAFPQRVVFGQLIQPPADVAATVETHAGSLTLNMVTFYFVTDTGSTCSEVAASSFLLFTKYFLVMRNKVSFFLRIIEIINKK